MTSNGLVVQLKVGFGKILMGNFIRILKLKYPAIGKLAAKFVGKNSGSTAHIKKKI